MANTLLRFWRNTSVATTAPGQTASLEPSLLGYEWDSSPDNRFMPAGLIDLSSTTVQDPTAYNTDFGNVDTAGTATDNLVEYRDPTSGALVFGAGTVFWSWGLSNQHDNSPSPFSSSTSDPNVQQAMVNLFADMGVQPQTLQASLVIASQSTDKTPPTSSISTVSSTNVVEGQTVTVSGTATDDRRRRDRRRSGLVRWRKDLASGEWPGRLSKHELDLQFHGAGAGNIHDRISRGR